VRSKLTPYTHICLRLRPLLFSHTVQCINIINVNDDQQDATILAHLLIPNQLYMFRAISSPIIRST